ncbi:MAG: phosphate ABC transporter substrate-binding protein PstS [Acidimicrobiia bacterium]
MNRISPRTRWTLALLLVFGLVAAACGSSSSKKSSGDTSSTAKTKALAAATLSGSGSTFQQAYDETVIQAFKAAQPAVTVTYAGGGSGKGQTDLQGGLVQWAGSDSVPPAADAAKYKGPVLIFPTVGGPITVSYNLSGVNKLNLSADTIAGIFQGTIKTWDDSAIKADNPGATLPSTAITVAHRSDGSGTTANFTKFLTKAAPTTWKLGSDKIVAWPSSQQAGNGNAGVAQIVQGTNGAIGYVDFSDAKAANLKFASVKNESGKFVAASIDGATAAMETATVNPDLSFDPIDASGAKAYPITSPTYILVYATQTDTAVGNALKGFLNFIYGDGQALAAQVDFAKLPANILSQAKSQVDKITVS